MKKFFNFNLYLPVENESSIHNIAFFNETVILCESGEKYAHIKQHLQCKQLGTNTLVDINVQGNRWLTFFLLEALLWIMDQKQWFKIKTL